jgi:hypothetical protein
LAGAAPPTGAIAAGDFTNDGFADVAVLGSTEIVVLPGDNKGGLGMPLKTAATSTAQIVMAGHIDADAKLDLIALDLTNNAMTVWLGMGDGTFQQGKGRSTVNGPRSVALADMNGDGKMDALIPDLMNANVTVYYGVGDGTFTDGTTIAAGGSPVSVVAGDLDLDGTQDVAVSSFGRKTVTTALDAGGMFKMMDYQLTGAPGAIHLGNFNGDRWPDLTIPLTSLNSVAVLSGHGDGTFNAPTLWPSDMAPLQEVVGDFNGDGLDDIAVTNQTSMAVSVLLNTSQ